VAGTATCEELAWGDCIIVSPWLVYPPDPPPIAKQHYNLENVCFFLHNSTRPVIFLNSTTGSARVTEAKHSLHQKRLNEMMYFSWIKLELLFCIHRQTQTNKKLDFLSMELETHI
jgi:hypothetical protein